MNEHLEALMFYRRLKSALDMGTGIKVLVWKDEDGEMIADVLIPPSETELGYSVNKGKLSEFIDGFKNE